VGEAAPVSTVIKTTCTTCGEVPISPDDIELMVSPTAPQMSYFSFHCPRCERLVRKPAGREVIDLLFNAGVPVLPLDVPQEALEKHPGPALTSNDLLDLMTELEGL
jgi:predicted RNA-binding Zn-ribbon protein involved in translation (DUF1610 family)